MDAKNKLSIIIIKSDIKHYNLPTYVAVDNEENRKLIAELLPIVNVKDRLRTRNKTKKIKLPLWYRNKKQQGKLLWLD